MSTAVAPITGDPAYLIYETANFHGGDVSKLEGVIDALSGHRYPLRGIKFHPIAAETLALPDFSAYPLYQRFEQSHETWRRLIDLASRRIGDVWLEMADANCVSVLADNLPKIAGLKFQASMLRNEEVITELGRTDCSGLTVFANVAGLELSAIAERLGRLATLGAREIVLEFGFQSYPTELADSQLGKIAVLRAAFPGHRIAIADHLDAKNPFARILPVLAVAMGASFVEKHVCLERSSTEFDASSALEPAEVAELQRNLLDAAAALSAGFIVDSERRYLAQTNLKPVLRSAVAEGRVVGTEGFTYRRTPRPALSMQEVSGGRFVARRPLPAGAVVSADDIGPARIGAVVACRMKSTRLATKATRLIDGMTSVERCLDNCLRFPGIDSVVLATSVHPDDAVLEQHTLGGRVGFHKGDPDDVLRRYLEVCDRERLDVVVRVTADNPVMSPEIVKVLLDRHFASGADFTRARTEAVGTAPQIMSVEAMRRVMRIFGGAPLSEYMNMYFENNPSEFKIEIVDLPPELVRDYRLTLDYEEDHRLFDELFRRLRQAGRQPYLRDVFAILDADPELAVSNRSNPIVYQTDPDLIRRLKEGTTIPVSAAHRGTTGG